SSLAASEPRCEAGAEGLTATLPARASESSVHPGCPSEAACLRGQIALGSFTKPPLLVRHLESSTQGTFVPFQVFPLLGHLPPLLLSFGDVPKLLKPPQDREAEVPFRSVLAFGLLNHVQDNGLAAGIHAFGEAGEALVQLHTLYLVLAPAKALYEQPVQRMVHLSLLPGVRVLILLLLTRALTRERRLRLTRTRTRADYSRPGRP